MRLRRQKEEEPNHIRCILRMLLPMALKYLLYRANRITLLVLWNNVTPTRHPPAAITLNACSAARYRLPSASLLQVLEFAVAAPPQSRRAEEPPTQGFGV